MRTFSSAFKVGLLLLVALVGGWFLYRAIVQRAGGSRGYRVYALFRDATGLVPRSRVTLAGIPVGAIQSIRLQDGLARVDILVNRDVELFEEATVSRRSASLLGEYILVLAPGTTGTRRLVDGDRLRVLQEGTSTDDILNNVGAISLRVRQIVDRVGDVFGNDEGRRQMADALRNLQEITAEVNRTIHANTDVITHAIRNADNIVAQGGPDVRAILSNVRDATGRVDHLVADNQAGISDTLANVNQTVRNANAASQDLREALRHIESITAGIDRGEGTAGRLVRDDALIDEVQGIAEGVNDFIGPLTRLQTIVGLRAEYNFLSNGLKSYFEIRLQPREDRYYLLELIDDNRGLVERSSTVITSTNPNDPPAWRRTEERTYRSLRFTLQYARRIGPATFRFGIRESTGGVGVDFHLFRDRFELRNDVFDFSTSALPRLRVAAAVEFVRHMWIIGGVDDILNPRRDLFLGAMLRFNDEDLRSILPFAGGLAGGLR